MADDLISRQEAIDALFELYEYQMDIDPTEAADLVRQGIYLAEKKIEQLPSAQSEWDDLLIICGNCDHTIHVSKRNSQHIIRCKDCMYASPNGTYGCMLERFSPNDKSERLFSNDFCSLAEVKADEGD